MKTWIQPIFDRTIFDISVKAPNAFLNAVDLRRIENNIAYLSERLNLLGYRIMPIIPNGWEKCGVPRVTDLQRICDDIIKIVSAYHKPDGFSDPSNIRVKFLHFNDVNTIEMNLNLIMDLIEQGLLHSYLSSFTHGQLRAYTHEQIRTGGVNSANT